MEIKATYGTRSISVRQTSFGVADRLIVLRLAKDPDRAHEVIYNGPYALVHAQLGRFQSNGAATISRSRPGLLDAALGEHERVSRRVWPRAPWLPEKVFSPARRLVLHYIHGEN